MTASVRLVDGTDPAADSVADMATQASQVSKPDGNTLVGFPEHDNFDAGRGILDFLNLEHSDPNNLSPSLFGPQGPSDGLPSGYSFDHGASIANTNDMATAPPPQEVPFTHFTDSLTNTMPTPVAITPPSLMSMDSLGSTNPDTALPFRGSNLAAPEVNAIAPELLTTAHSTMTSHWHPQTDVQEQPQIPNEPTVTKVCIIIDQLATANAGVFRHEFHDGSWKLTYVKNDDDDSYSVKVTIPMSVTATNNEPMDMEWRAALVPTSQLAKGVDLDDVKTTAYGLDWTSLKENNAVDSGSLTQTQARTIKPCMTFDVVPRKKYFLVILVNEVGVRGAPKIISVQCDRNTRARGGSKRKTQGQDEEEEDEGDASDSSSSTAVKRIKVVHDAMPQNTQLIAPFSTSAPAQQARGPLTPPPSPHFNPDIALRNFLEMTVRFDANIITLLQSVRFQAADIHNAASLLFALHVRGATSAWTPDNVVETFALLGVHADVIRRHAWSGTLSYPEPLHVIAQCPCPLLVNAMMEYLFPRSVPTPLELSCEHGSHAGHNPMVCETCRAFAATSALSLPNAKGFLPIHVAAWKRNTVFVAHHLRVMGAKATFAVANHCDGDGGNFFHATCGSKSAVDWLDQLWNDVILDESDRRVVAEALLSEDDRGRTPLEMAKFQFENREETPCGTKRRTFYWVKSKTV